MSIVEFLSQPVWQRLGLTLVHFLWQGLAVAVLVGAFVRVLRLKHGNARYDAYLLAFIVMMVCPIVTFIAIDTSVEPVLAPPVTEAEAEPLELSKSISYPVVPGDDVLPKTDTPTLEFARVADRAGSIPLRERISDYLRVSLPWALVAWMIGVLVLSMRLLLGFIGVHRWRRRLEPLPERLGQRVASLSEKLGMQDFSRVFISPRVLQAIAVGYLRPMVLLPVAMVTQMQPVMLEAVIAHELAHIRRFDLWINLAQRVMETLLFYHPAAWWLSNHLRSERELCCDELAVRATGERLTYASALESVGRARLMAKQPVLAAGLGRYNKPILRRVHHVLGLAPAQRNCSFWLAGVITVMLLTALVISTTLAVTAKTRSVPHSEEATTAENGNESAAIPAEDNTESINGVTLVAEADIKNIDSWRSLGIRNGFGNGEPICDFIARKDYVSKHGNALRKGDRFVIGSAEVVDSTDKFGNSGTKLILRAASPHEGMTFVCYGYSSADRSFWAIDLEKIQQALDGYFIVEGRPQVTQLTDPHEVREYPVASPKAKEIWGASTEGVGVRLYADKTVLTKGEFPRFRLDVRNEGGRSLGVAMNPHHVEMEVDGTWYVPHTGFRDGVDYVLSLGPGRERKDIPVPGEWAKWADRSGRNRLRFDPGVHDVRVAYLLYPDMRNPREFIRPISNPLRIEILPVSAADALAAADSGERVRIVARQNVSNLSSLLAVKPDEIRELRFDPDNHNQETPTPLTDSDLAALSHLTSLEVLSLYNTQVSDAGLVHLKGLTSLRVLSLRKTQVTGKGLAHLKGLARLRELDLGATQVDDAGLAYVAQLNGLEVLDLRWSKVEGHGLRFLKDLPALRDLDVWKLHFDRASAEHLGELTQLHSLGLTTCSFEDKELGFLPRLTSLEWLSLGFAGVRIEEGNLLSNLKRMPSLRWLILHPPDISSNAEASLQAVLPGLRIGYITSENGQGRYRNLSRQERAVSNPVEMQVVAEVDEDTTWGEAVRGVRMRLHSPKRRWAMGQTPQLRVDLQNMGGNDFDMLMLSNVFWELEVDGVWYWSRAMLLGDIPIVSFAPGTRRDNVEIPLGEHLNWQSKEGGEPLKFRPGIHTIRAGICIGAMDAHVETWDVDKRGEVITSRVIWLEVLPASDAGLTIAEPQSDPAKCSAASDEGLEVFEGLTFIAAADMKRIDSWRSLGIRNGFGNGEPICDFIARAKSYLPRKIWPKEYTTGNW